MADDLISTDPSNETNLHIVSSQTQNSCCINHVQSPSQAKSKTLSFFHRYYPSAVNMQLLSHVKSLPHMNKSRDGINVTTTEWSKFLQFVKSERHKLPEAPTQAVRELTSQLCNERVSNLVELLPSLASLFDNQLSSEWVRQNLKILQTIVKNSPNYQFTLDTRIEILNIISRWITKDFIPEIISFLNIFSNEGRSISGLEPDLYEWIYGFLSYYKHENFNLSHPSVKIILNFCSKLIKFNFSIFVPEEIANIVELIEIMTDMGELDDEGGLILINLFDTLVRFGYLPIQCIPSFCKLMIHLNSDSRWKNSSWAIVKNALRSHCATHIICSMFDLIHSPEWTLSKSKETIELIGEALWGPDRIEPQIYPTFSSLEHFSLILDSSSSLSNNHIIISAVFHQLYNLISIRSNNLSPVDWEVIIDILSRSAKLMREFPWDDSKPFLLGSDSSDIYDFNSLSELWYRFNQLITIISPSITLLHVNDVQKFIFVLNECWNDLAEPLALNTLIYLSTTNVFLPSRPDWEVSLQRLLSRFFITSSPKAQSKILDIVERTFLSCSFAYENTFVDLIVSNLLTKIFELENPDIICKLYKLVIRFWDLSLDDYTPLFKILSKPFNSNEAKNPTEDQSISLQHQIYCSFILAHWFSLSLINRLENCSYLYSLLSQIASNAKLYAEPRLIAFTVLFYVYSDSSKSVFFGQTPLNEEEINQCLNLLSDSDLLLNITSYHYWIFSGFRVARLWNNEDSYNHQNLEPKCTNSVAFPHIAAGFDRANSFSLPTEQFLSIIIQSLTDEHSWDVMAYILCQTPAYLINHLLHTDHRDHILSFRSKICNLVTSGGFGSKISKLPNHIKKGNLYSQIYRLLDSTIAYKSLFTKSEKDEIVSAYHIGLSRWSNTSIQCIHSLTLCCVEFPMSLTRSLPTILLKLSQIMSASTISIHILEFLSTLVTIPDLYSNFVDDDFKRVLGISIQYIQYHMGMNQTANVSQSHQVYLHYVLTMAYQVISIWLTRIRPADRPKYVPFLVRGLLLANKGRSNLDDQTTTCLDMIAKFSYSASESLLSNWDLIKDKIFTKDAILGEASYWIYGDMIIQVELSKTGFGEVKIRSSSAIHQLVKKINDYTSDLIPLNQPDHEPSQATENDLLSIENINNNNYLTIHQNILKQVTSEFKGPGELIPSQADLNHIPRPRLNQIAKLDDGIIRGISVLDRMPIVDFHKIGVVYVGRGQTHEKDILANSIGSDNYQKFLHNLGNLVRLKQLKGVYTGGLDTEMDLDGKYAYSWSDGLTQLIFHAATLMPTRLKFDPNCNAKKRHIGNDYVSIVYNDSGLDYKFDTLPGQFNLVNIIITPLSELNSDTTQVENCPTPTLTHFEQDCNQMFKIETQFRSDIHHLSPLVGGKVVCAPSVAPLVRQVALNCSIFTQIFLKPKDYSTNWVERFRQINRIKERVNNQTSPQ